MARRRCGPRRVQAAQQRCHFPGRRADGGFEAGVEANQEVGAQEAINRIREATSGRLDIKLFPANQLGSDTDLLGQVRNGGVEIFNLSSLILATFVPLSTPSATWSPTAHCAPSGRRP